MPVTQPLRRTVQSDDGFTLVEMLAALVIIGAALMALLAGFLASAKSIQLQKQKSEAVRVALDLHENLRLAAYDDPELEVGAPHSGTRTSPDGRVYTWTSTVTERDARPDEDVAGDLVKEVATVVRWTARDGDEKSVTYTTAIARDARSIGLPNGYLQEIRSVTVAPDPSASVDFDGHVAQDIIVTIVLTGHIASDTATVQWTDDAGTFTRIATSTDGRFWRATVPAGAGGITLHLAEGAKNDLAFTATTNTGLTATSSLAVWGPVESSPVIADFKVAPNPVEVRDNGKKRHQNTKDTTVSCAVTGLDNTVDSRDSVKVTLYDESGSPVEQTLTRTGVAGGTATYAHTWAASTWYPYRGTQTWTCAVRRFSDGGPASTTTTVVVK